MTDIEREPSIQSTTRRALRASVRNTLAPREPLISHFSPSTFFLLPSLHGTTRRISAQTRAWIVAAFHHRRLRSSVYLAFFYFFGGWSLSAPADLVLNNGDEPQSLDPSIVTAQIDGRIVPRALRGSHHA